MNFYAAGAAALLASGIILHVFLAGRTVHADMQAALEGFPKALESATWHGVSLWLGLHFVLALVAVFYAHPMMTGALVFGALHAGLLGIVCLAMSLHLCNSWTAMRQSYLFMLISGALAGAAVASVV
ncbi:hypothetical protein QMT40_000302 [Parvibaculaceae bacterium PLY_AMNH_Bact1]|nr:hypothetical protein QMT40_000302 [Parvibaculaceae bacterium PLY_AMNH_Bact1]